MDSSRFIPPEELWSKQTERDAALRDLASQEPTYALAGRHESGISGATDPVPTDRLLLVSWPGRIGFRRRQQRTRHLGGSPVSRAQFRSSAYRVRNRALQFYHQAHPERFRARPETPTPAGTVGINLPDETVTNEPK